ncbi:MAG: polysaccharide deacetylase family protein [Parvibaculaceae bacterium]
MDRTIDAVDVAGFMEASRRHDARHVPIRDFAYPAGVRIAINFTLDFDAMLLRRLWNEPPLQRAKGEFGGRVGIWRLIDLFNAHGVKVTVFTPGRICELYPKALRHIVTSGHELADHMWEHQVPDAPRLEEDHLRKAVAALSALANAPVTGTRSSHTPALLRRAGITYNSFTSARTMPFYELDADGRNELLQLPFHYALDDAMYFSFGWMGTPNAAQRLYDPDTVLEIWWKAVLQQYRAGGYVNFLLHPFVSGHALRVDMIEELIRRIKGLPGTWLPTCGELARYCLEAHPFEAQAHPS